MFSLKLLFAFFMILSWSSPEHEFYKLFPWEDTDVFNTRVASLEDQLGTGLKEYKGFFQTQIF